MAPIEPDLTNSNLQFLVVFGSYVVGTTGLTTLVCYDVLYKSYKALPPSQDTRHRQSNREKHVRLFSALAVLSLAAFCYHAGRYLSISYTIWAQEMGHEMSLRTLGWDINSRLHLGRWYKDTSVVLDAWEIIIERSRRYWWTQQALLGTGLWSIFVGIEGRRRRIHHLWAFLLLAQVVAPSFAMNLFFLAVLLTPVPLPAQPAETAAVHPWTALSSTQASASTLISRWPISAKDALETLKKYIPPLPTRPHPPGWTPSPYALFPSIAILQFCTFLLPYSSSTPEFIPVLLVPHIALFRLAYMDRFTPSAYGSFDKPNRKYASVYRLASFLALLLQIKSTFTALLDNDPGAYPSSHPHSAYLAALHLPHEHERSSLSRSTLSFSRILTSLNDHPAVALIGYDVLLTSLSLACWAATRGLDVRKILFSAAVIHVVPPTSSSSEEGELSSALSVSKRSRRRKRKSTITSPNSDDALPSESEPIKDTAAKSDPTFHLAEPAKIARGEEDEAENLEAAAVGGALWCLGGLGVLAAGVLGADSAF